MFSLTPSSHGAPPPSGPLAKESDDDASLLKKLRLLLVEDDMDSRELLSELLQMLGCDVCAVDSASAGFAALSSFQPQVIVSDISMPEEDGYAFMMRVRTLAADQGGATPSLALTAMTTPRDRDLALAAGFDAHVGKPVIIPNLVRAIAELVRGR